MNIENIIKEVEQRLDITTIESMFRFGNLSGRDIDLFLITSEDQLYKQIEFDIYDITIIGSKYVRRLIQIKDPIVIEPLLTGKLILGTDNNTQILNDKNNVQTEEAICVIQIIINSTMM